MSSEMIKLLMIEDDLVDRMAFQRMVKAEGLPYDHTCVSSAKAGKEALRSGTFDVVISDFNLGDGTAFDLITEVPEGTVIIVVTGAGDEGIAVKAMKAGASDYVIKDQGGNYLKILPVTVANSIKAKSTERELHRHHVELERLVEELSRINQELAQEMEQRQRAQEELRESLESSANIVEAIPSGLLTFQHQPPGELFLVAGNPEAERILEIKIAQWRGQEIDEIWPNARRQGLTKALLHTIRTGELYEDDAGVYQKGGVTRLFRIRAFRIPGELLGVAFEDVTERKSAELALLQAWEEQQERIAETATLTNENRGLRRAMESFRRTEELPVRASRLSAMVHMARPLVDEFAELFGIFRGSSEHALRHLESSSFSEIEQPLREILDTVERGSRTLTQLERFAKASTGPTGARTGRVFSLNEVVRRALHECKLLPDNTTAEGSPKISPKVELSEPCLVEGEESELVEVLANVVQNAVEAMPEGGTVKVRTCQEGNQSVVWVEDQGTGIPQADIMSIFEPCWTSKESHSGLGLKASFGIVHSHGGTIRVYSRVNRGTKVRVALPTAGQPTEQPDEAVR